MHIAVIIGSGFSGISMGISLKANGIHDFIILEKATNIGGTWRENTYPGAECDIPSALYSYSFEPYPDWEYKWSHQPQILKYINHCVDKYDLRKHIHTNQELVSAHWTDDLFWNIITKDGSTYQAKTFIPAIGQLHHPSIPKFKDLGSFEGSSFHSAQWDHKVDLKDKSIAVIGNAASAVQFIPQIAKVAKEITVFQRSANWMLPKQDRLYMEWEKKLVKKFPILLRIYRKKIWLLGGALFSLMQNGNNLLRKFYQNKTVHYIKEHIKDPELVKELTPTYPMGGKRILFSDDYYEALSKSHVHLITDQLESINASGIKTSDGSMYDADVIIYATGFKTNPFLMNLDIRGKENISIHDAWKDGPKNYLGMTVNQFPNMFMMYGPNTNLGHNSIIIMSEAQANYITQCISHLIKNNKNSIEVKKPAIDSYYSEIQKRLKKMIWAQIDQSWYQSSNGNIPNNWPGRTMEYTKRTKQVNVDHYTIT